MDTMTEYSTWERPFAPMRPRIVAVAGGWFNLDAGFEDRATSTMPLGLLVGEQPGPTSRSELPLWPYPPGSAGGRLHEMSGMETSNYLIRLARVNLARRPVTRWDRTWAEHRMHQLLATLPDGARVLLCGARARDAVPATAGSAWFSQHVVQATHGFVGVVPIPHPSGRNREYRSAENLATATVALHWAAGLGPEDYDTATEGVMEHA